jgi:hypothetical protein
VVLDGVNSCLLLGLPQKLTMPNVKDGRDDAKNANDRNKAIVENHDEENCTTLMTLPQNLVMASCLMRILMKGTTTVGHA